MNKTKLWMIAAITVANGSCNVFYIRISLVLYSIEQFSLIERGTLANKRYIQWHIFFSIASDILTSSRTSNKMPSSKNPSKNPCRFLCYFKNIHYLCSSSLTEALPVGWTDEVGSLYIGKALLDALCLTHRNLAVPN